MRAASPSSYSGLTAPIRLYSCTESFTFLTVSDLREPHFATPPQPTSPALPAEPIAAKVNILLVDDHEPNLTALEVILDSPHYNLIKAQSGAKALEYMRRFEFAVVLLDVQMPGMDGFETAQHIRAMETVQRTPIVFVTAIDRDNSYAERGYQVGAVDYIVKPINPNILKPKIEFFVEFHQSRKRLAALEGDSRFQLMADSAPVLIWISGVDKVSNWFNKAWLEFTGLSLEEQLRTGWSKTIHPDDFQRCIAIYEAAFERRQEFKMDYRLRHHSGTYRWVLDHGIPHFSADGSFRGYMGTCMDIEDQKQAIRARDEFLSIASHELKTPVTSLKLQLQMLARQLNKPDAPAIKPEHLKNLAEVGNRQINQLVNLIDDMLDVSRISTGHLTFEMENVDLALLAKEVLASFAQQFRNANIDLHSEFEEDLLVHCDRHRIEQVISNLLTNALKYGARKPVSLHVRKVNGQASIIVEDKGIGISPGNLSRIFERFERAVSPSTVSGLGLGLYISRQIMSAHQGEIRVESQINKGSKFVITLPLVENQVSGKEATQVH